MRTMGTVGFYICMQAALKSNSYEATLSVMNG